MTKQTYKYNGKKNNLNSSVQGCSLFVAIGATILFFIFGGKDIFYEYKFELIIILVIIGGMLIRIFKKKATNLTYSITLNKDSIFIASIGEIPLNNIKIDVYKVNDEFSRYHLYDSNGLLAIYSVFSDDFLKQLEKTSISINYLKEISSKAFPDEVVVKVEHNTELKYSLISGFYKHKDSEKVIPDNFMYDPKFTLLK